MTDSDSDDSMDFTSVPHTPAFVYSSTAPECQMRSPEIVQSPFIPQAQSVQLKSDEDDYLGPCVAGEPTTPSALDRPSIPLEAVHLPSVGPSCDSTPAKNLEAASEASISSFATSTTLCDSPEDPDLSSGDHHSDQQASQDCTNGGPICGSCSALTVLSPMRSSSKQSTRKTRSTFCSAIKSLRCRHVSCTGVCCTHT